ncbi:MAG: M16 family metallopeptidase, partial [Pyrinomonadaceae bacterium]
MKISNLLLRIFALTVLALALTLSPSTAVRAQTPQATPPPPAPPRSVQFPKPVEKTLANGLRVIVIDRPGTPLVTSQLAIRNGAEVDPPELAGLGNMLADLVTKGTQKRSATQIAEEIEALGGTLYSSARWDSTRIGVDVMSSKVGPAIDILADVVRRPAFSAEEIDRLRQQTLDDLTVELGEPGSIARYVASRVIFGDAPYGQPLAGTTETITRIGR